VTLLAQIPPPPGPAIPLGPFDLRMYGLLIAIGAYLALLLVVRRYARYGRDPGIAEKAALLALGGGLVGARIGYVIPRFLGEDGFLYDPVGIIAIWRGGLAFFGGLVGGALAVIVYLRVKDLTIPPMADAVAPALPLAQAIGRWGNYFNQELFGRPTDLPWALEVEAHRVPARYAGESTFHPTFLYESLWNLALVGVILGIDKAGWLKRRGSLLFIYLIGYGIGRGWIEALRVDTVERYLGLSRNNWIAIGVVLIGVVGLVWWERRPTAPLVADDPEPWSDQPEDVAATEPSVAADDQDADETSGADDTATVEDQDTDEDQHAADDDTRSGEDGEVADTAEGREDATVDPDRDER
jgi:prolipoprotein diacylglyceryl transferase